jgi:bacillopeptidase F (M6 metalloprotease family)
VEASTDGGKTWQILTTPSGTDTDPSGNSYGWGYTGKTRGWIEESVNLGQFAGQNVQLRFEYVTDAAVNGEGFLLDDVSIPEINYFTDFEADDGGWQAAGFARVQNVLPQIFRLALITKGSETKVQTIEVAPDQTAEISLDFGSDLTDAILVVSGTTRFTRGEGSYTVSIK